MKMNPQIIFALKRTQILALFLIILNYGCEGGVQKCRKIFKVGIDRYIKKDLKGAEIKFKKCLECDSDFDAAHLYLAKIFYFQGRDDNFKAALDSYLDKSENPVEGMKLQARWLIGKKDLTRAKEVLHRTLQLSPQDIGTLYLMGSLYYMEGDYNTAIATFNKSYGAYSYMKQIHEKMGMMYAHLGLKERATLNRKMSRTIDKWQKEIQNNAAK